MILLIDNYDSFVYNLARYVRELGEETVVRRHDTTTPEEIEALRPSHIIISPGPCSPGEAGISTEVVRRFGPATPVLGVCLGHQCIGYALLDRFLHPDTTRAETLPDRADGARARPRTPGFVPPPAALVR